MLVLAVGHEHDVELVGCAVFLQQPPEQLERLGDAGAAALAPQPLEDGSLAAAVVEDDVVHRHTPGAERLPDRRALDAHVVDDGAHGPRVIDHLHHEARNA
jgi:hypothetical protein